MAQVRSQGSQRHICVVHSGTGKGFYPNTSVFNTSVFLCKYHSTKAPFLSSSYQDKQLDPQNFRAAVESTLQSAVQHSAGIMAAVTVIVRCSVCCSINLMLTAEAPFVTDMQFLYRQQHTAAKLSGWNSTDSRNLNVLGRKRNEGSGL